jgi:rare lipoprotein A
VKSASFVTPDGRFPAAWQLGALLLLGACAPFPEQPGADGRDWGPDSAPAGLENVAEPVPRDEPRSRYGNPQSYEVFGRTYYVRDSAEGYRERGIASWYGKKFHGRRTSSGEPYDMYAMTAAHTSLPLPSYVRVTNLENGRSVVVRVNDRGPFADNRIIDLSYAAAHRIGMVEQGTARVEVEAITGRGRAFVNGGPVLIQVGAFHDRSNAQALSRRLESARIGPVRIDSEGGRVHRVRIGPVRGEDFERLMASLRDFGISDAQVLSP